jgi:hypothetical protein
MFSHTQAHIECDSWAVGSDASYPVGPVSELSLETNYLDWGYKWFLPEICLSLSLYYQCYTTSADDKAWLNKERAIYKYCIGLWCVY